MKLYEIHEAIHALIERGFDVDEETGEIIEDIADRLAALQMAEADKLENIALFIKNLAAEAAAVKAEEKALAERRKAKEKRQEWLEKFLSDYLLSIDKERFETARVKLSFRKSAAVDVDAAVFLPWATKEDRFLRYLEPAIDKVGIKAAIKEGQAVPGATIVTRQNLQIS